MTILWVENHRRFADIAVSHFLAGHDVTVVPSIAEARRALAATRYSVVMLDFDLDDGKGIELMDAILSIANRPFVIATSSHSTGNQALLAAGADAICGKKEFAAIDRVLASVPIL